jgi:hypothetical protein
LEVLQHLLVQNLHTYRREFHTLSDDEMMIQVNQFDGKMNKLWPLFDEVDFCEMGIEKVCKNLDIYQKHNQTLSLQHLAKKYDLSEI